MDSPAVLPAMLLPEAADGVEVVVLARSMAAGNAAALAACAHIAPAPGGEARP